MTFIGEFVENLPRLPKRDAAARDSPNPITLMRSLSPMQWAFFLSGWLAWLCDAMDFFSVSLSVSRLIKPNAFDRPTSKITQSITLTLLFRPVGAIVFGLISDRFGRKWPLVSNLIIVAVLSLATGFTKTFQQFLAVRSLFGIAMGGIWGLSVASALENMPMEARGLFSGIMQQGYAVGYLIAAVINLYVVPKYNTWRVLFFVSAGISLGAAAIRAILPESYYFTERRKAELENNTHMSSSEKSKIFIREAGRALKLHWVRCIYGVLLMTGFNFFSHGSQDLYPTYINLGKGLSPHAATVATIIGNCGAVAGGTIAGYASQYLGRRITIIVCCIWTVVWLPLWLLPNKFGPLAAGAFFLQSGVQGAWGVIPIYLTEISPVAFRSVYPGVAYQLGNMVSSASAQIESTAGEKIKLNGKPDYGKVSAILIGVVAGFIIVCVLFGREQHGAHFEKGLAAFEKGGGKDIIVEGTPVSGSGQQSEVDASDKEKAEYAHDESATTATKAEIV